jgi:hypothetical protein
MNRTGAALLSAAVAVSAFVVPIESAAATPAPAATGQRLTNLDHLDFLTDRVTVQPSAAHTTYRLAQDPNIGVLWVYADHQPDGSFTRVGGGVYDAATDTYGQGAFDTDDIARAAVVYLREWRATGSSHAKQQAYQQLRGLGYFQTLTGPKAGEVVLWMQPDGTLNPSAKPTDNPDPSDSDASYWLARTLWAYGEGYAAFRHSDPAFAAFLADRMSLALRALNRDVLVDYGRYQVLHGARVPAWLIADGADASSEAALGLAAYTRANGPGAAAARAALAELTRGIAELSAGSTTTYPYRALLPWALSRSQWHAWGAQMASGLAAAYPLLGRPALLKAAVADTAGFTPQLLTSTGPVNGIQPTVTGGAQIAYGADGRVQALYAVSRLTHSSGLHDLAGVAAGWFFGANTAGVPVYDPATGVTNDGVEADGRVNGNSGAESTIHGLLTMQLLDAHPDLAQLARRSAHISVRDGLTTVEAETGSLAGSATVVTPDPQWTGDALWSPDPGAQAVAAAAGSTVTWALPAASQPRLVQPVVEYLPGSAARTRFDVGSTSGTVRYGATGRQGVATTPSLLLPADLGLVAPARASTVTARTTGGTGRIDALLVMPVVATLAASGDGHGTALLTSKSARSQVRSVTVAGAGRALLRSYDRDGRLLGASRTSDASVTAVVAPGGFTLITR